MGCCCGGKEEEYPLLMCFFESKNKEQKDYCIKLKDNFKNRQSIRFEIKSRPDTPFSIKLKIKDNITEIQSHFNSSEEVMNETLQKAYELLKEEK